MNKIELEILSVNEASAHINEGVHELFLLLFKEKGGGRMLPVFIGGHEARSILIALHGTRLERPLLYDTVIEILADNDITLKYVCIVNKRGETFYSQLVFDTEGGERVYDSRTSDAVSLAIRLRVPVYVDEEILEEVKDRVKIQHTDNAPVDVLGDDEIDDMMQRAIADENYERASELRDEKLRRENADK